MFGDIPFGGGFLGVSNSTSLSAFIDNAWNSNGGTWSDGNAHYYSTTEATSRDIALYAAYESWANANATMYAECPTCPKTSQYQAYIDAKQMFYYEDGVVINTPGFSQSSGTEAIIDYANDYNNRVLNVAGAIYGLYDQALNQNPQIRIATANKLSSFFGGSAGVHNQALKQLGGVISKGGNIGGGVSLGISLGNAAYQTYQGKDNTAMWVDTAISTTLFLGSVIPNPLQPLFIGGSLLYGGTRLGAGDQIDNVINTNLGYR
jgi:hypothetical protein